MQNTTLSELDMAFFSDGFRLAEENLSNEINEASILQMVEQTYAYIEGFIEQFLEHCKAEGSNVDCMKGCGFCCHQSVFMLPYEAFYLVKKHKDLITGEQFKQRILDKDAITSQMKVNEFLTYTKPCPFLVDNVCSVYDARPMACRLFLSKKVKSCMDERNNPSDFGKYAELYELPLHIGRMLNEGISAYFSENGLRSFEWILESSLRILITDDTAMAKWLSGEDIFKPREIDDEEWKYLKKFDIAE